MGDMKGPGECYNVTLQGQKETARRRFQCCNRNVSGRGQLAHVLDALSVRLPVGQLFCDEPAAILACGRDGEAALLDSDPYDVSCARLQGGGKGAALVKNSLRISSHDITFIS